MSTSRSICTGEKLELRGHFQIAMVSIIQIE